MTISENIVGELASIEETLSQPGTYPIGAGVMESLLQDVNQLKQVEATFGSSMPTDFEGIKQGIEKLAELTTQVPQIQGNVANLQELVQEKLDTKISEEMQTDQIGTLTQFGEYIRT